MTECKHPDVEYDPGNYLPPFGWEQRPGMFCVDCREEIEDEEPDIEPFWPDDAENGD